MRARRGLCREVVSIPQMFLGRDGPAQVTSANHVQQLRNTHLGSAKAPYSLKSFSFSLTYLHVLIATLHFAD